MRQSPGCVDWQIMRRTLWRADFDDARNPNPLPLKKARPGQRRHSGPRCLSPDSGQARCLIESGPGGSVVSVNVVLSGVS